MDGLTGQPVHSGSWFGLPDFGITEAIGSLLGSPTTSQGGSNILPNAPTQNASTGPVQAPAQAVSSPTTVNSGTAVNSGSAVGTGGSQPSSFDPNAAAKQAADAAAARQAAQEAAIRGNISSSYQPIFDELDRQMGALPGQQADLEGQVGTLASQQGQQTQSQADTQSAHLDQSAEDEKTQSKGTLRDLADNVRHILQGAQFYLGGLGAADSSAVTDAAGAIGSTAEKARGNVLNTLNQGLTQISRAKNDVQTVLTQNLKQIDDWKTNELATIKSQFVDQLNQLHTAKANAQGQEGQAIAQLIQGTQQQFNAVLSNLDNAVFNYKSSVASWAQQRQANLEDNLKLLAATGQYTSGSAGQYATTLAKVGNSFVPVVTNKGTGQVMSGQPIGLGNVTDPNQQQNPFQTLFQNISGALGGNNSGSTPLDPNAIQ